MRKNALDWASRPMGASALQHKDIAVAGTSPGNFGTARGQLALRQMSIALVRELLTVLRDQIRAHAVVR